MIKVFTNTAPEDEFGKFVSLYDNLLSEDIPYQRIFEYKEEILNQQYQTEFPDGYIQIND